jgi:formate dehydrogenase subunit gamma
MISLLAGARFIFGAIALVALIALATPVRAQQNAPVDPEASVVNEQTLLQQFRRIQGDIDQPNQRERVLIQPDGRIWDHFHEVTLRWIGVIAILGTLALLAAGYFLLGRLRISAGRSGRKVQRFTGFERFTHWLTAMSFVILALTGLNITFGKLLLLPLIGPEAFSAFSQLAKYAHNYVSFAFVIGLAVIVAMWMRDNIPDWTDVAWFRQGGGFIRSKHAPARRFNAGEKIVYWLALGAGMAVAVSGGLLLFPFYVTDIFGMQISQAVHGIVALLFIALILGHIYIGTLGMEGAFEAMGSGEVDYNWAKEHHDLWLEEQIVKDRLSEHLKFASTRSGE